MLADGDRESVDAGITDSGKCPLWVESRQSSSPTPISILLSFLSASTPKSELKLAFPS